MEVDVVVVVAAAAAAAIIITNIIIILTATSPSTYIHIPHPRRQCRGGGAVQASPPVSGAGSWITAGTTG